MPNLHAVQSKVEAAAQAVATLSAGQWPGWAIYLLENFDNELRAAGEDPRPILEAVHQALEVRLALGRW